MGYRKKWKRNEEIILYIILIDNSEHKNMIKVGNGFPRLHKLFIHKEMQVVTKTCIKPLPISYTSPSRNCQASLMQG